MTHRRILIVACLFGGLTLLAYGVHRWPPDFVRREYYDRKGNKRLETRVAFETADKRERILGAADFGAATLLFSAGMVIRFLRFRWGAPTRSPQGDLFDLLVVGSCGICGVIAGFLAVVAVVNLAAVRGAGYSTISAFWM